MHVQWEWIKVFRRLPYTATATFFGDTDGVYAHCTTLARIFFWSFEIDLFFAILQILF